MKQYEINIMKTRKSIKLFGFDQFRWWRHRHLQDFYRHLVARYQRTRMKFSKQFLTSFRKKYFFWLPIQISCLPVRSNDCYFRRKSSGDSRFPLPFFTVYSKFARVHWKDRPIWSIFTFGPDSHSCLWRSRLDQSV